MNRWTVLFATMIISVFVALGCSGNGVNPVTPSAGPDLTNGSDISGQTTGSNTYLFGYYDVYLDITTKTMEVVADRSAAYTLNVVPFLNRMASPKWGITFGDLVVDDTDPLTLKVRVDFEWHHPFPTLDQYKAYDLMGVIISNGDATLNYGVNVGQLGTDTYMTNADGYTRWFNPTEFTTELIFGYAPGGIQNLAGNALINPYKAYGSGLDPDGDLWEWLTGGSNNDGLWETGAGRYMDLEFPYTPDGEGLSFAYAAVLCWEEQYDGPYTPYHRQEPIACKAEVTDESIWCDGTNSGGNLTLDMDLWAWGGQPSHVRVESTVLSSVVDVTDPPTVGGDNYSTYHLDAPVDVPLSTSLGHEFWVIAECDNFDYSNGFEDDVVPHADGVLTAFFKFPLYVSPTPYCMTEFVSITPSSAGMGTTVNNAYVVCTELEAGPSLGVKLTNGVDPDIIGTGVTLMSPTTMNADFDLTTAVKGKYDVEVTNGCGGSPGVGVEAFEVLGGWMIETQGPLPTPFPTDTAKNFCVQADTTLSANAGVFYNYSTGSSSFLVYKYPLDYSSNGTLKMTLSHWMGMNAMFGTPALMGDFQITPTGIPLFSSNYTGVIYSPFTGQDIPWWGTAAGAFQIGLLPWDNNFNVGGHFIDWDKGYSLTSNVWGFWNNYTHMGMYFGDAFKVSSPFGTYNYTEFVGYVPYDPVGGNDGMVDDTYVVKMAVDDNPQGLDPSFDIIHYYLEAAPAPYAIECIENNESMSLPNALATIKTFAGIPVDVTTFNAFYTGGPGTNNWVVALEQVGSDWTIEAWQQDGTFVGALIGSVPGVPYGIDLDCKNHKLHVWYDDAGTMKYAIIIYL